MACGSCIGAGTEPALQTTIGWVPRHAALRTAPKGLVELGADSRNNGPVAEIIALGDSVVRVVTDFAGVACSVFAACIRFCRGRAVVTVADDASKGSTGRLQEQQFHERGRHAEDHRNKRRGMPSSARESSRFVDTRSRMCCDGVVARWPAVCAGVVAVLCYLNSLDGEFVHDDMVAVVGNPDVTGEHHRPRTQRAPSSLWLNDFWGRPMTDPQSHKSYRPLTVLSFRANFLASGLQVRGYHVINVALHCACSALVATVAQSDVRMQSLPAGLAATLFAAHPLHTEAVSSIVGRAELLCCLFLLLSFVCYQRCTDFHCAVASSKLALWLAACGLMAACALLSKEQGISVLPVCMLMRLRTLYVSSTKRPLRPHAGLWPHKSLYGSPRWRSVLRRLLDTAHISIRDPCLATLTAMFALLLTFRLWMLHGALPRFSEMDNPASFSPELLTRLLTYAYLCAFNAWLALCPSTLSYDWQMGSIPLLRTPLDFRNVATLALFATLAAVTWRGLLWTSQHCRPSSESCPDCHELLDDSSNSDGGPLLPVLLTVLPFLPASNLFVPVGFVVAERVLYIPSIGICLLAGQGFSRLWTKGRALSCSCLLVVFFSHLVLLAVRTWDRNAVWACREALFESGIRDVPGNAKMHYNYANLQKDLGDTPLAIEHYERALKLWPEHASAHNNLGTLMTSPEDAEHHYRQALRINPSHPGAHYNLATLCNKRGEKELAEMLLERAVELDPDFCEAYSSLAALAADQGSPARSEKLHRLALSSDPGNADARNNYGTFLQSQGRSEEAVAQYQRALDLQPNHTVALLNAARSLRSMKLNLQAESVYKRALLVQPDPQVMDNLAVFYINVGRLDKARQVYDELEELFPEHLDSKVHHAQFLMQTRSFAAAEELVLEAIRRNSTHREALHQAALLYGHTNQTTLALDYILKALRLCPADDLSCARLHAEHGDILKDLGDLGSSAQSYMLAIRLDPDLAHAHLNLAVIKHLQGDFSSAFRHYQTAFSLDPKNPLIANNMEKLRRRLTRPWAPGTGFDGNSPCNSTVSS